VRAELRQAAEGADVTADVTAAARSLPALEVSSLVKRYGGRTVLDGVGLEVAPGSLHGLLGPNGAGKTTLLGSVLGLVRPDGGTIRILGRERGESGGAWLDQVGGFVEAARFYPYLTGRANLALLARLDRSGDDGLVDDLLDQVGLADAADRRVRGYSLGMRQRLGLAAALLRRPRLLILDEPTNGLDPAGIRGLGQALRAAVGRGLAVLLSSHDMHQVEDLCDHFTVLHRGRVVWQGSAASMRSAAPDPIWRLRAPQPAASLLAEVGGLTCLDEGDEQLILTGRPERLDAYVVALGRAGVPVRELVLTSSALTTMFFDLTGDDQS
jgi:ABC-2 type transport system ATP-binding protein